MFKPLSDAARVLSGTLGFPTSPENRPLIPMHQSNGPPANPGHSDSTHPHSPPTQTTGGRPDVVPFGAGTENLFSFAVAQMSNAVNPRKNPFIIDEMDESEDNTEGHSGGEVSLSLSIFLLFTSINLSPVHRLHLER